MIRDGDGYMMLVLPPTIMSTRKPQRRLGRPLAMAGEEEFSASFSTGERGAVPPLGYVYGIKTLWDPEHHAGDRMKKVYIYISKRAIT